MAEKNINKPKHYWNSSINRELHARECNSRTEFRKKYRIGYANSTKEELDIWFTKTHKNKAYPTFFFHNKLNRSEVASKCKNRSDFAKKFGRAYALSSDEELQEYFGDPLLLGDRYIYTYEFKNKFIYIGLTCDLRTRNYDHLNTRGSVYDYIQETNETPIYKLLTSKAIDERDAGELEDFIIEKYRSMGYNIINKYPGGSLGGNKKRITFEEIKQECLKYSTIIDLVNNNEYVYKEALRLNKKEELFKHMTPLFRTLTTEYIEEQVLKYPTRGKLKKGDEPIYNKLRKTGLINKYYPTCQVLEK